MDKILIISNARHNELGAFIQQRGAFEVVGCYASISENVLEIQNKIIDVNKTLYLYQPEEAAASIRSDMQVLERMMRSNSFFKPGEISFITRTTEECKQAEKYFITVMKSCNYTNYTIQNIEDVISFTTVYDSLMGVTSNEDFKNTYKTYYRTERGVESTEEYERQDDSDLIIEPFIFDNLKDYQNQTDIVSSMNSTIEFRDNDKYKVNTLSDPSFGQMKIDSVLGEAEVVLLSGKPKSGLSTWTSVLATSAVAAGKTVLVLDYTSNSDVEGHLNADNIKFSNLGMKEILQGRLGNGKLNLLSLSGDAERRIKFNFIKSAFSNKLLDFDVILFPVDYRDFAFCAELIRDELDNIFITCVPRYSDVSEIIDFVEILSGVSTTVITNDVFGVRTDDFMELQQIKDTLSIIEARVVDSIEFDSVDIGANLSKALLG